jgi:ketosteroid isomerase-like protein
VVDRARWLQLAMGRIVCEEFVWQELRVRSLGEAGDVGLVHGRSSQIARIDGRDWSGTFLITDVWVRREGTWRVAARHGTGPISPA